MSSIIDTCVVVDVLRIATVLLENLSWLTSCLENDRWPVLGLEQQVGAFVEIEVTSRLPSIGDLHAATVLSPTFESPRGDSLHALSS